VQRHDHGRLTLQSGESMGSERGTKRIRRILHKDSVRALGSDLPQHFRNLRQPPSLQIHRPRVDPLSPQHVNQRFMKVIRAAEQWFDRPTERHQSQEVCPPAGDRLQPLQ
jgi:hypothetical protein